MGIERLSQTEATMPETSPSNAVVLVGSFAPIHDGHFDALGSAARAIARNGSGPGTALLVPNSQGYVERKLNGSLGPWNYERRVDEICRRNPLSDVLTLVDDISGNNIDLEQINDRVPITIEGHLGIAACQIHFVVGSDQLPSMESVLSDGESRVVCVLRPDRPISESICFDSRWVQDAIESGRLTVTRRANMDSDISSTGIRLLATAI